MMNIRCSFFAIVAIRSIFAAEISNAGWWKHSVLYEIWPRSFKDTNNDGIGDLRGIIEKLDYISESGINIIWLASISKSPQVDAGYDVSNYLEIDSDYGTLDDLKDLVEKAHLRGIRVIMDFVPNHTSTQHQWFIDSVKGVEEFRDYYIWANAIIDENGKRQPPNNWISLARNSAWTWNEERQQYYLHQFTPAQADLNYRNPKVVHEMKNVLQFWLDQGLDGFRVDAVSFVFEKENLANEPLSGNPKTTNTDYEHLNHIYTKDLPETYEVVYDWRKLLDEYSKVHGGDERILITETYTDMYHTMLYFGSSDGSKLGAHFSFNFNLVIDLSIDSTAQDVVNAINRWLEAIPQIYTSNWQLGNHDRPRAATYCGPENVDGFNMLNLLLPGVAISYNGEEIGQENGEVSYEEGHDPMTRDPKIFEQSRDFFRTPFQWNESINAGFNDGAKPWLPVSRKYKETNLKQQQETDGLSHYKIYKALTELRNSTTVLRGNLKIKAIDEYVLLMTRSFNDSSVALIFNKGDKEAVVNVKEDVKDENKIELTSLGSSKKLGSRLNNTSKLILESHEALVVSF